MKFAKFYLVCLAFNEKKRQEKGEGKEQGGKSSLKLHRMNFYYYCFLTCFTYILIKIKQNFLRCHGSVFRRFFFSINFIILS
jgi:hypothetical protein